MIKIDDNKRKQLDQIFMGIILDTQNKAQNLKPKNNGNLAQIFHREQISEILQGCAMLIAGWNSGFIDEKGIERTVKNLKSLEENEMAKRIENLKNL